MTPGTSGWDGDPTTSIAEVDPSSGTFRYRGVAIEELIGRVPFGATWGLLVDGRFSPDLPRAEPFPLPVRTGDIRVDVQSALAQMAPVWGFRPLHDIDVETARTQLAQVSALTLSFVAQSARGHELPMVPQREVDKADDVAGRFVIRWRGEADPRYIEVIDTYLVAAAEHGLTPSTVTARVIASTGADVAACVSGAVGAISGPLHGGSLSRVWHMIEAAERSGDITAYLHRLLDSGRRVMGFGHRWHRGEDPRATVLRERCRELRAPRYEATLAFEQAARAVLAERVSHRPLAPNLELWVPTLLGVVDIPSTMFTPLFSCARTAGWSAHILEQAQERPMVRPFASYVGPPPRRADDVPGWEAVRLRR